tara:strand:+ start:218 stop:742 length:525 start_codon:yes stop_codon:yes gene_type:complete
MAAEIDGTGIVFSDSTRLDSKYDIFAQGTTSIFYQASAPTGWSKSNSNDNKALRVVTGTGGPGQGGGSNSFTSAFPSSKPVSGNFPISGTVGNHTLTSNQLPSHTHSNGGAVTLSPGGGDVKSGGGWTRSTPGTGNNSTNASAHNHGFSSGSASFSANINLAVQYIDVIVCSFS